MALLLQSGADISRKALDQSTPLHVAVSNKRSAAVALLLERGADLDAQDKDGCSPLHLVCFFIVVCLFP